MARKIISFDCDGVITPGGFVPPELRTNKHYAFLKPQPGAVEALDFLSNMYDIYIISQRSHENSNLGLRAWCHWILGLELDKIAGVITGPSAGAKEGTYMNKNLVVETLGCLVHFDDNPHHLVGMKCGVLFPSDMSESQDTAQTNIFPKVFGWDGVMEFLTTPGMTLHSDRGDLVSPAEVYVADPVRLVN